ncbi:MAG TPA: DUF302 domain-containing protein [Candidatus Mucispirillum faecigallinarum]|uniref:DUF302 domain-containing protein n=1 Tax=Candidatus Mucispirillum faecigallinarum TaxID=2838699 RepID=A0A9D2GU67_9BACT|nr:DUF302 domain-containing protein [Candidatus Mucispirillum faecigallinarum]
MKKFKLLLTAVFVLGFAAISFAAGHTTAIESKYDYKTTVDKTIKAIEANKKATLFAVINHGENAKKLNAQMGQGTLLIFGNPAFGATFMKDYPQAGIDLPLKIYIFEDKGKVYFSYVNPTDIAKNYKGADKHEFIKGTQNMLDGMAKNILK